MEERDSLDSLINKALDMLYERDFSLIRRRLHEQCIVFRFALYLYQLLQDTEFAIYDLDLEYNKNIDGAKNTKNRTKGTRPDFILHKRERNDGNLLILEFKHEDNISDKQEDINKIKDFKDPAGEYKYRYGGLIIIRNKRNKTKVKWI